MKFGDKLIQLRKKQGISQEELGEKLNVTRQTISKWELGQSKPDTDKILEICKLLNVDIRELTDDEVSLNQSNQNNNNYNLEDIKPRKWLQIVLIIIALSIVVVLANKIITDQKEKKNRFNNITNSITDHITNNITDKITNNETNIDKTRFNQHLESMSGTKSGFLLKNYLDDVVTSNKKNLNHIISVKYDDINTTDPDEIVNLKTNMENGDKFEVSIDYDSDGYIDLITISLIEKDKSKIKAFNSQFELYVGNNFGSFVGTVLDSVITNNNTNKDHLINVRYGSVKTSDVTEIKKIKKKLGEWTKYEVSFEYDEMGYIYKMIIEK